MKNNNQSSMTAATATSECQLIWTIPPKQRNHKAFRSPFLLCHRHYPTPTVTCLLLLWQYSYKPNDAPPKPFITSLSRCVYTTQVDAYKPNRNDYRRTGKGLGGVGKGLGGGSAPLVEQDVSLELAHGLGRAQADPCVVELVPLSVGRVEAVPETPNRP